MASVTSSATQFAGPLAGKIVAITRAPDQAGPLASRLRALGASVLEVPLIDIVDPLDNGAALQAAVASASQYDWVVVTSPNAARRYLDALAAAPDVVASSRGPAIAAIGPGTAQVIVERGRTVDLVPQRAIGEGLADAFPTGRGRVLFPRAETARAVVEDAIRAKGWLVDVVHAYRTVPAVLTAANVEQLLRAHIVVLTSSSTATVTAAAIASTFAIGRRPHAIVSMGPATTATAFDVGLEVTVTADPSTIDGLLTACIEAALSPS